MRLSLLMQTVLLRISTALAFALYWYVALAVLVAEPWLSRMVCLRASRPDSFLLTLCWCGIPSTHEQRQSEQLRAAFTPGFESIIVGQALPLAAPQESSLLRDAMQSSAQALRLGLEQWNRLDTCYLGMSENIMSGFSQAVLGSPSISDLWMTWRSVIEVPFGFVPGLP